MSEPRRRVPPPPAAEPPRGPRRIAARGPVGAAPRRGWLRRHRGAGITAPVLLLLGLGLASHALDEPLRRTLERHVNAHLTGYTVRLGHAHLNPFALALTLRDVVVRQNANPEPPVADLALLRASVQWKELLSLHLVADALFDHPRVHVDLRQLRSDVGDDVPLRRRGWQQALESIYPLKFNRISVVEGTAAYIDTDPEHPLRLAHVNLVAENVRNIHSRDRDYPSSVHAEGVLFERGRVRVDGHADFLAEPFPGVHVLYALDGVPLDRLGTLPRRANLAVTGGVLTAAGRLEYGPRYRDVRAQTVTIDGLRVDYVHTAPTAAAEKARAQTAVRAAERAQTPMRIERLRLTNAELGLDDRARNPRYRVFLDGVRLEATHLTLGPVPGPTRATLDGRFMGTGKAHAEATVRGAGDLQVDVAVEGASLPKLNDLLRAYGKFDVASGSFAVYSQMAVRDGRVQGYVKPLFAGVNVYEPRQDARKKPVRKLYEHLVDAAARLLRNRASASVATEVDISGPLDDPESSTWQTFVNLLSNAFVRAILPGFDREIERLRHPSRPPRAGGNAAAPKRVVTGAGQPGNSRPEAGIAVPKGGTPR